MGRKKNELYRIKNTETGLYYCGGSGIRIKNPDFDPKAKCPGWGDPRRPQDAYNGKHPWNRHYDLTWNKWGKVMTNFEGCQRIISRLSNTSKDLRKTKTKNILFGNQLSNNLQIVRCRIVDIKDGQEEKE